MEDFISKCRQAAGYIGEWDRVTAIGHRDADGICASAILKMGFKNKEVDIRIIRHSTDLEELARQCKGTLPVFVDYGSSEIKNIEKAFDDFFILDHHPTREEHPKMVNPWDHGIDGTRELSGAGVTYFVAKAYNSENTRLSNIALVGAMGDKMYLSGFKGPNKVILDDAREENILNNGEERERLMVSELPFHTEWISALDVANIIDSCASVNRPEVAVDMLLGDRDAYRTAMDIHNEYKNRYDSQMDAIRSSWEGIVADNSQHLAYFIYLPQTEPGFTGALAEEIVLETPDKPVVIISKAPYGLKASGRSTDEQIGKYGIDLGRALSVASSRCGGKGGGHDVAAGATFDGSEIESFKSIATLELFSQWRSRLKMIFEMEAENEKRSSSLSSSLAVDNERYGSTSSMAISLGNKIYIMVLSEDIGTFKNTVDDLIVCLTSSKDIVGLRTDIME